MSLPARSASSAHRAASHGIARQRARGRTIAALIAIALAASSLSISASPAAAVTYTGRITGRVTDGGAPLAGVSVLASRGGGISGWNITGSAETKADGTYDLGGLATGTYQVSFSDGARLAFYNGKPFISSADPVSVMNGRVTSGINGTLRQGTGAIVGTVTDGGGPVAGIEVTVMRNGGGGTWDGGAWTVTAADGTYSAPGLVQNAYMVKFDDPSGVHVSQSYRTLAGSMVIGVSPDTTTTASMVLGGSGHIAGRVTAGAVPMEGVGVNAYMADGEGGWAWVDDAWTAADGTYDITVPAPGTFRVDFSDQTRTYPYQCYVNARDIAHGTDVVVQPGTTRSGIDGALGPGGRIAGRVTSGTVPLDAVTVALYESDGYGGWAWINDWYTRADGTYELGGMPSGSYRVVFSDGAKLYHTQVFDRADTTDTIEPDGEDLAKGVDVTVTVGQTTKGIDGRLVEMDYTPATRLPSLIGIASSVGSTRLLRPFVLSGALAPGRRGDLVVVEVQKPGSARWSYSSARLGYASTVDGRGMWWYRYTPRLRGTYRYRARFAGVSSRLASLSRVISVAVR
jgi:hypothetical protein